MSQGAPLRWCSAAPWHTVWEPLTQYHSHSLGCWYEFLSRKQKRKSRGQLHKNGTWEYISARGRKKVAKGHRYKGASPRVIDLFH